MEKKKRANETVAVNRKAFFNYEMLETFNAGIALSGSEVKSVRQKNVSFEGAFALADKEEIFLNNLHIKPYKFDTINPPNPTRARKLLLRKTEIKRIAGKLQTKGLSLIPLEIYFAGGWAKVKLGLAKGKKTHDKRDTIKKRDVQREVEREFRQR